MGQTKSFTLCSTPRERMLNEVFTTAMEGGIGYWSAARTYRWSDGEPDYNMINEFRADIEDCTGEDAFDPVTIDADVIRKGIRLAWDWAKDNGDVDNYQVIALRCLRYGKYDDVDYDATTADLIVQFGLFGEVVFG